MSIYYVYKNEGDRLDDNAARKTNGPLVAVASVGQLVKRGHEASVLVYADTKAVLRTRLSGLKKRLREIQGASVYETLTESGTDARDGRYYAGLDVRAEHPVTVISAEQVNLIAEAQRKRGQQ